MKVFKWTLRFREKIVGMYAVHCWRVKWLETKMNEKLVNLQCVLVAGAARELNLPKHLKLFASIFLAVNVAYQKKKKILIPQYS